MSGIVKGKDVLDALYELNTPSKLNEIVEHMSAKCEASKTALTAAVQTILEAGVIHGYIQETEEKYYTENPKDDNNDEVQPNQSEPKELFKEKELTTSSKSLEVAKNERIPAKNKLYKWHSKVKYFQTSSDDEGELRDEAELRGSRYRKRSRSRSSGKRSKSHSRRRSRRRRHA